MSPTLTDDELVRELVDRGERALPTMRVDPDAVVERGHRRRRRRTSIRSAVGVLGLAAVALGTVQLDGSLREDAGPTPAARLAAVADADVLAATGTVPVETSVGTVHDTGIPVDPAAPDGPTWVLETVELGPKDAVDVAVVLEPDGELLDAGGTAPPVTRVLTARSYDPRNGELGERLPGASLERGDGVGPPEVEPTGAEVDDTLVAFGLAGRGYTPHAYVAGDGAGVADVEQSRVLVPTFLVPDVGGRVYFLRVAGEQPWPHVTVHPAQDVALQLSGNPGGHPWGR